MVIESCKFETVWICLNLCVENLMSSFYSYPQSYKRNHSVFLGVCGCVLYFSTKMAVHVSKHPKSRSVHIRFVRFLFHVIFKLTTFIVNLDKHGVKISAVNPLGTVLRVSGAWHVSMYPVVLTARAFSFFSVLWSQWVFSELRCHKNHPREGVCASGWRMDGAQLTYRRWGGCRGRIFTGKWIGSQFSVLDRSPSLFREVKKYSSREARMWFTYWWDRAIFSLFRC